MFDPTALSVRARLVQTTNGMYRFRAAYDGGGEFFPGRPLHSGVWSDESDVREIDDPHEIAPDGAEGVASWDSSSEPAELETESAGTPPRDPEAAPG